MTQDQDLDLLAGVGSGSEHDPAQERGEHLVDQPQRHRRIMPGIRRWRSSRSAHVSRVSGTHTRRRSGPPALTSWPSTGTATGSILSRSRSTTGGSWPPPRPDQTPLGRATDSWVAAVRTRSRWRLRRWPRYARHTSSTADRWPTGWPPSGCCRSASPPAAATSTRPPGWSVTTPRPPRRSRSTCSRPPAISIPTNENLYRDIMALQLRVGDKFAAANTLRLLASPTCRHRRSSGCTRG